jgi:hypothetical protein
LLVESIKKLKYLKIPRIVKFITKANIKKCFLDLISLES